MNRIVSTMRTGLALLALFFASPLAARAQQGCSNYTTEASAIAASVIGNLYTADFDFRPLTGMVPLGTYSPQNIQTLCNTMRQSAPTEDSSRKISFFDVTTHYIVITHVVDPDPDDDYIVSGLSTVVVFDRNGTKIAAFSF